MNARLRIMIIAAAALATQPYLALAQTTRWEIDAGLVLRAGSSATLRESPHAGDPNLPSGGRDVEGRATELLGGGVAGAASVTFRFTPSWSVALGGAAGPLGEKTTMLGGDEGTSFVDGSLQMLHASLGYRLQVRGIAPLKLEVGPGWARRKADPTQFEAEGWSPAVHGRVEFIFPAPVPRMFFAGGVEDYAVFWDNAALRQRTTRPGRTAGYEYDGVHHVPSANVRMGFAF